MTTSGRILGILGAGLTGLVAMLFLGVAMGGPEFSQGLGIALNDAASSVIGRVVFAVVGLGIIAADVALLLRALGLGASKVINFESDSGQMAVEVSALQECLRRTAIEDPDVEDAVCRLRIPRKGLEKPIICYVEVGLHERANVPGKGNDLSAAIRRRFLQVIPVETDPVVNINIRIRPPKPDAEAGKSTQAMDAQGPPAGDEEEDTLPDVPDFTGERRYGDDDEEKTDEKSEES